MASRKEAVASTVEVTSGVFNEEKITLNGAVGNKTSKKPIPARLDLELEDLFAENVVAKIWNVAVNLFKKQVLSKFSVGRCNPLIGLQNNVLTHYPETVPQTGPHAGQHELREAEFWTCGFFPGSLYALLERSMKYPQYFKIPFSNRLQFSKELLELARTWAEPLHAMATRTDTHDMGFIIQPALRMDWELTGNVKSLESVLVAARSLASRYDERVNAIRSWDQAINKRYSYTDKDVDFLVIIDSMCSKYRSY